MTEDWAEIRRLHKSEQMSIKAIVRSTGLARNSHAQVSMEAPRGGMRWPRSDGSTSGRSGSSQMRV